MDPDDVARLVEELKLSSEASAATVHVAVSDASKTSRDLKPFLVGKFFAVRVVNRETLRIQVSRILQLRRSVDIEIVRDNLFVIVFGSAEDRSHALHDGPWHFFNSLMDFKAPIGFQNPTDVRFDDISMWIQLHNLPIACMNPTYIRKIGAQVGKIQEIDVGEGGNCVGQFARVRVCRPIDKPLQRCVKVADVLTDESRIILLLYEKLPDVCHACGRVGHVFRHCGDDDADKDNMGFGNWLRASKVMEDMQDGKNNDGLGLEEDLGEGVNSGLFEGEECEDFLGLNDKEFQEAAGVKSGEEVALFEGTVDVVCEQERCADPRVMEVDESNGLQGVGEGARRVEVNAMCAFVEKNGRGEVNGISHANEEKIKGMSWTRRAREKKKLVVPASPLSARVLGRRKSESHDNGNSESKRSKKLKIDTDEVNVKLARMVAAAVHPRRAQ
ncbi:hypothetical protein C2S52_001132 [Perilla frutescens var. hirtella]|nr:hypothetical protein C2S52_001132 [Perilla frutescens var. hirtella]